MPSSCSSCRSCTPARSGANARPSSPDLKEEEGASMDLTPYIRWIIFLHVLGAFMFVAGHGVSMFVVFQVRREADRTKLAALLDLSGWSLGVAGIGLLILFVSGILAGIVLNSWGALWLLVALVLFVVIALVMTPVGGTYLRNLRVAIGQRPRNAKPGDPDP